MAGTYRSYASRLVFVAIITILALSIKAVWFKIFSKDAKEEDQKIELVQELEESPKPSASLVPLTSTIPSPSLDEIEEVWPTGYVIIKDKVILSMSDGTTRWASRKYDQASDPIDLITKSSVVLDGERLFFKKAPKPPNAEVLSGSVPEREPATWRTPPEATPTRSEEDMSKEEPKKKEDSSSLEYAFF